MPMKYEITEIAHPEYPWLHRIRALIDVNEKVPKGSIGGYVRNEKNLSQEGTCWIYDQAVCCEQAKVEQEAGLYDGAMVCGYSLITGDAVMYDRAVADGNCCIQSGEIKDDVRVSGNAMITKHPETGCSPLICGKSMVYGIVCGKFMIRGMVLPGQNLNNPTKDYFVFDQDKWDVLAEEKKLKSPESYEKKRQKKRKERER